jgi:hypothetical protein
MRRIMHVIERGADVARVIRTSNARALGVRRIAAPLNIAQLLRAIAKGPQAAAPA